MHPYTQANPMKSKTDFDLISIIRKNKFTWIQRACARVCVCMVPAFGQSHVLVSFYGARWSENTDWCVKSKCDHGTAFNRFSFSNITKPNDVALLIIYLNYLPHAMYNTANTYCIPHCSFNHTLAVSKVYSLHWVEVDSSSALWVLHFVIIYI